MKITIVSAEQNSSKVELEIHQCIYNNQTEKWEVPYVEYDFFTSNICPHLIKPVYINFSYDQAHICVRNSNDVTLLSGWLRDADRKARESLRNMAG